jgi:hypothetical protein
MIGLAGGSNIYQDNGYPADAYDDGGSSDDGGAYDDGGSYDDGGGNDGAASPAPARRPFRTLQDFFSGRGGMF